MPAIDSVQYQNDNEVADARRAHREFRIREAYLGAARDLVGRRVYSAAAASAHMMAHTGRTPTLRYEICTCS